MNKDVQVGVGVFLFRDNQVLLGERIGAHGAGTWALPGGQLDFGESVEQCARREVIEETGLELSAFRRVGFTDDIFHGEGIHCVTLYLAARCPEGEPENREPEYCKQWRWFEFDSLPQPLFLPLSSFLEKTPVSDILEI